MPDYLAGPLMSATPDAMEGAVVEPIAVIGLACRLPGAGDVAEFWSNLTGGVESIRLTSLEEQAEYGVAPHQLEDPNFVPAIAVLDDFECLDAPFFGMSSREAELRDPQQRVFLELAYTALEDAGYDPARYQGEIGVYAGSGEDAYQWRYTRRNSKIFAAAGPVGVAISSHPDYMATFVSYKLNLRGPSLTLHTACSTSLVALHVACEALRGGECDMALTGGVSIDLPARRGYIFQEGGIHSPDGHCRTFDAQAAGTVWSSGGGVAVLKRLADAVRDGDHIRAVVLGNAINNDGSAKAGFTAPSEQGQAAAVAQALAVADVDARTISYVEAHGTGTALGDPIEVAALSSAYRRYSTDVGWCAIGSVKTNIGHLGPAAGITGIIKTVLSLENKLIPPSLHYQAPNPKIDFDRNPFYVNTTLSTWEPNGTPLRAGVSSFGMGGTNGHVILQQAPPVPQPDDDGRPVHLLRLSARTSTALEASAQRLASHLTEVQAGQHGTPRLADVAYTLRVGRREMPHRLAVVASDLADAAAALADPARRITAVARKKPPRLALLFSGQGAQYAGMGAGLYQAEPVFRDTIDECAGLIGGRLGTAAADGPGAGSRADLREVIFGQDEEALRQTAVTQPAIFAVEYALARLWLSWGAEPDAMAGHSIGEYVAATLAGVFTLPDALHLVTERGRLMQSLPPGGMLAVQLSEDEIRKRLPDGLSVAAVNGPGACVVSGPAELVEGFARELAGDQVGSRKLRTSHAFHSAMMEPILAEFRAAAASVQRRAPDRPFLSNVTGQWITSDEATDPGYWARHVREAVRFSDCMATMLSSGNWMLVECGPGRQLCGLARLQPGAADQVTAVPSLPSRGEAKTDPQVLYTAAAKAWTAGVELTAGAPGRRTPLPTYPWERTYHYIKPDTDAADTDDIPDSGNAELPVEDWFAVPVWRQVPPPAARQAPSRVLLFAGRACAGLDADLTAAGAEVLTVTPGEEFGWDGGTGYRLRPGVRDDYDALIDHISASGGIPARIVHGWALDGRPATGAGPVWQAQEAGFFSLLSLAQALAATQPASDVHIDVLTSGTADVTGSDLVRPEHATVAGIALVLPPELPWLSVRHIDTGPVTPAAALLAELLSPPGSQFIALRGARRWQREFSDVRVPAGGGDLPAGPGLRERGVYVITGGLGGIGITLAEDLATRLSARLVLVSRSALPGRADWDAHLSSHGTTERAGRAIAAIRRMERAGAEVLVVTADVTDEAGARRIRDEAVAWFGAVNGIVHAAGLPGGGMAEVKERAAAEQVMRPKLTGTLALRDAFAGDSLDFVVLCSSVTGVAGGFGQVDYCAANAFMDAHARGPHGWPAPVVSVNWGSWREVGMAAEVAAPAAFRALQRGERVTPINHPVLTGMLASSQDEPGWCRGVISPAAHWVLAEHRIYGVPVLPGTCHLEVARAALAAVSDPPTANHIAELRDVVFIDPLAVPDETSAELRVLFTRGADGFDFEVVTLTGGQSRTHARGTAAWVTRPAPSQADLAAIRDRCVLAAHDVDGVAISESGLLTFGPRWGNVSKIYEGQGEQLALLEASGPTPTELTDWVLHPAMLDEATAFGSVSGDASYLPLGYGQITIHGSLPARLWSHLRYRDTGSTEVVVADLSLLDDDGRELVTISEFTLRKVDEESVRVSLTGDTADETARVPASGTAPANGPAVSADETEAPGEPLAGEPLAGHAMTGGISPPDGAEAFRRLIAADLGPQVVISATPISQVIASARQITQETIEEAISGPEAAARPERLAADGFVAPRTELEATITRLWSEVLGVEQLGVTDDFFEVGGNSLIAVQLISMLRKEVGVRLPMRSLFERSTVAGTAELVTELLSEQGADNGQPEPAEAEPAGPTTIPRLTRQPG
jgi:acyl transferase domain-containing protein